ncbi:MAG TPA: hypothetical protein VMW73_07440 [Spirochaetia bacterium]|nr:hypothetical protein [Spirochaetia bacterium]
MASTMNTPQLVEAGLQSLPLPGHDELLKRSERVAINNRFSSTKSGADAAIMAAVRNGVKHVIFIIREILREVLALFRKSNSTSSC